MVPTKQQVLEALAAIPAPDGKPLPQAGTLSDIVIGDGKVLFSISVDAAAVKAWEPVRKRAFCWWPASWERRIGASSAAVTGGPPVSPPPNGNRAAKWRE